MNLITIALVFLSNISSVPEEHGKQQIFTGNHSVSSISAGTKGVGLHDVYADDGCQLWCFQNSSSDSVTNGMQFLILEARDRAFKEHTSTPLQEVERELMEYSVAESNLKDYWIAFVNYQITIVGMRTEEDELAKSANAKAITILQSIADKTSEDYALLALSKGLSFAFTSAMKAPSIGKQIATCIKNGMAMDESNFRLHYAQASVDFHTPKQYGGGRIAEKHLLLAVKLPEKNAVNSLLPTWGKPEAYELLIRYYLRENQSGKASTVYYEAKELFPDSPIIMAHQNAFSE